jgi:hypothetical protein
MVTNFASCWCYLGYWHCVVSQVDAHVSEKHTVSIFRADITNLGSEGLTQSLTKEGWGKGLDHRQGTWKKGPDQYGVFKQVTRPMKPHSTKMQDNTSIKPTAVKTSNLTKFVSFDCMPTFITYTYIYNIDKSKVRKICAKKSFKRASFRFQVVHVLLFFK